MAERYVLGPNAARELKRLIRGTGEVSRRESSSEGLSVDKDFANPFTVKWAASADGGSGAWIIWLPTPGLLVVDGDTADVTTGLDAVGGDYPEGWYEIPDDALSREEGGTLYLNVPEGVVVSYDSTPEVAEGSHSIAICTASVDSSTGERSVKQFVTSAVTFGGAGEGEYNSYGCDEVSISLVSGQESITGIETTGNLFHICGFGKFTNSAHPTPVGTYSPAEDLEIDASGNSDANVAFLVRTGNSPSADSNGLAYKRLKIGGGASSAFAYQKTTSASQGVASPVTTHKLVNCRFYWEGELKSLADFDVTGIIAGGSVYLTGVQAAPSSADPDPSWTWAIATSAASAPNGGKVLNYKLYDFANSKPSVDYRTSFMSLEDTTQKAKLTVGKANSSAKVEANAAGESAKLVVTDGTKTVTIDTADFPAECGGSIGIHEFKYVDKQGSVKSYHGLMCHDIDLSDIAPGNSIRTIETATVGGDPGGTRVTIKMTDETEYSFVIYNGSGGSGGSGGDDGDDDDDGQTGVISLNGANGNVYIIGGKGISVSRDRQTIKITADASKESDDADPQPADDSGGVCPHGDGGGVGGVSGDIGGGVPGGGDYHSGDGNCC